MLPFSLINGAVLPELCGTPPVKTLLDNLLHYWIEKQAGIDTCGCFHMGRTRELLIPFELLLSQMFNEGNVEIP